MDYFQLLNLSKEPFSNSPDPEFFYPSPEHVSCLQKLELAIRLQRGLNVVVGAIGTGKTTLCRHLIREFSADKALETHLILNPDFNTPMEFLYSLAELFGLSAPLEAENSKWQIEESIKQYLFRKGVDETKTVILLIDEGQKMPPFCLEILRELLNYETNDHKLLQIVIFAQEEFQQTIAEHPNLADRINAYLVLAPLTFQETRNLLQFRLNQAKDGYKEPRLFTTAGLWALHRATKGYPRKIIHLSHRVLLTMIIQNRPKAGWFLVRWCARMMLPGKPLSLLRLPAVIGLGLVALLMLGVFASEHLRLPSFAPTKAAKPAPTRQAMPVAEAQSPKRSRIPEPIKAAAPERFSAEAKPAATAPPAAQNETTAVGEKPTAGTPQSSAVSREATPPTSEALPATPQAAPPTPNTAGAAAKPQEEARVSEAGPQKAPQAEPPAPAPEAPSAAPPQPPGPSTEAAPPAFHPPELLGQVTARPGDHLEVMIRRVYGYFDQPLLKAVTQLNPQLTNPSALEVGKAVKFPPLPVRADPLPPDGRYVQVAQAATLNEACRLLRAYPRDAPPVFLLPHWTPGDGLKFGLALKDCCPNQQTAEATLAALPGSLAAHARILGKEDEQAVFMVK